MYIYAQHKNHIQLNFSHIFEKLKIFSLFFWLKRSELSNRTAKTNLKSQNVWFPPHCAQKENYMLIIVFYGVADMQKNFKKRQK